MGLSLLRDNSPFTITLTARVMCEWGIGIKIKAKLLLIAKRL